MSLTLTTVHSTGMAADMAAGIAAAMVMVAGMAAGVTSGMAGVRVVVVVLVAPPPRKKPSHHLPVQIPSACATSLSLYMQSSVVSDKPCADLQALVVVHGRRQGSIGVHQCR